MQEKGADLRLPPQRQRVSSEALSRREKSDHAIASWEEGGRCTGYVNYFRDYKRLGPIAKLVTS
jgi:hypothetical protein